MTEEMELNLDHVGFSQEHIWIIVQGTNSCPMLSIVYNLTAQDGHRAEDTSQEFPYITGTHVMSWA